MPIPSKSETERALTPFHGPIRSIIDDAWTEWRAVQRFREQSGFGPSLYSRTVSNYMFDAIARRAIPRLGSESSIMLLIDAQSFKVYISGILVRVKKGGEDHLGCNWPTQTALAFEEADGQLPGFPPETTKVEIVWLPNEIWTQVEQVMVVARDGDTLLWQYEIPPNVGADSGAVESMPTRPAKPEGTGSSDLVKPKVSKAKKEPKS